MEFISKKSMEEFFFLILVQKAFKEAKLLYIHSVMLSSQ